MGRALVVVIIQFSLFLILFIFGMLFDRFLLKTFPDVMTAPATQPANQTIITPQSPPPNAPMEGWFQRKKDHFFIPGQEETVEAIAKRFDVSLQAILEANPHLRHRATLRAGTAIRIPVTTPSSPNDQTPP